MRGLPQGRYRTALPWWKFYCQELAPGSRTIPASNLPTLTFAFQAGIPGFYDPVAGVPKALRVRYKFRGREHYAEVPDFMPTVLPLKGACLQQLRSSRGPRSCSPRVRGAACHYRHRRRARHCGDVRHRCGVSLFLDVDMLSSTVDHLVE